MVNYTVSVSSPNAASPLQVHDDGDDGIRVKGGELERDAAVGLEWQQQQQQQQQTEEDPVS
eukprot:3270208-Pyramimonas_sp.AAC.2